MRIGDFIDTDIEYHIVVQHYKETDYMEGVRGREGGGVVGWKVAGYDEVTEYRSEINMQRRQQMTNKIIDMNIIDKQWLEQKMVLEREKKR